MNVYGYVPINCFPSNAALTYWAASYAGLAGSEAGLAPSCFVLGLKKSQLPLTGSDVIHKTRSTLSPSCEDQLASLFPVTGRRTSYTSSESGAGHPHNGHTHHQQQHLRHPSQHQYSQHHHFFSTTPPLGSGLAPLQALCDSDVSAFTARSPATSDSFNPPPDTKTSLKFSISRILSEDFGKSRCEKENKFQLSSVPESCRSLTLCPCNSISCAAYTRPPSPYHKGPVASLSAVHALQPPTYPLSSSADALPGPYSILSTDSAFPNQPKRKRSWSRAVFSNLQRKGLEKRFEVQKYVTKPDRRQLAAMLGLTDAQVKVWFQNRRMKWRHAQQQGEKDKQTHQPDQKPVGELASSNSGHEIDVGDTTSSTDERSVEATETPESSRDVYESTPFLPPEEIDAPDVDVCRSESPVERNVRHTCASPAIYIQNCTTDLRLGLASSLKLRHEQSEETADSYCVPEPHADATITCPDNDLFIKMSRHKVLTSNDDLSPRNRQRSKLDLTGCSRIGLDPVSDLDVNDIDVDTNDTDVDINDTDMDTNDTNDSDSETIPVKKIS